MRIISSPHGSCDFDRPSQGLHDMKNAGFQSLFLDFSIICPTWEWENSGKKNLRAHRSEKIVERPELLQEQTDRFFTQAKKSGFDMPVARAPYLSWNTKRTDLNGALRQLTEESIKICGYADCRSIVIQPLFAGLSDAWEANKQFFLGLVKVARENQVIILLENQCRDINGHLVRGICSDAREAAAWVDELNRLAAAQFGERDTEDFGFCMDAGTCNLCGQNMYDFAVTLGSRIKAVVLRENNGNSNASLLPFTSVQKFAPQMDWLNLIRGLRRISFDGFLIMDFSDTAIAFSPILKPQLLSLAKAAADYFVWQIGMERLLKQYSSRVLFGAGNMCRNYMKCYGEQYPPLFTCDNNQALWETEFCGLTIKPPEALKGIKKDTAVLICNIYYREIEAQIREMGLKNPVVFFNDEYMPAFYFDRIDAVTRKSDQEAQE